MKIIAYTCGRLITLMIIINGIPVAMIFLSHSNFGVSHVTCFGQQDSSKPCTLKLEKVLLLFLLFLCLDDENMPKLGDEASGAESRQSTLSS